MNVGPTGLRARITHEHPAYFTIKFVFDKSPGSGKIEAGDIVVGANGKIMAALPGSRGDSLATTTPTPVPAARMIS